MHLRQTTYIVTSLLIALFMLTACGGGDDESDTIPMPEPEIEQPYPEPEPEDRRLPFPFQGFDCPTSYGEGYHCDLYSPDVFDVDNLPTYWIDSLPRQDSTADAQQMPIYHDHEQLYGIGVTIPEQHRRLMVGVDQGDLAGLSVTGEYGDTEIRLGTLNDGAGMEAVAAFLAEADGQRYQAAPKVRLIGPATPDETNRFVAAVQLVNAALPIRAKMRIVESASSFSRRGNAHGQGAEGNTIHVEFAPYTEFLDDVGGTTWNMLDSSGIESSYIKIQREAFASGSTRHFVTLLAHELMHALGLSHVSPEYDTIMEATRDVYTKVQGARSDSPVQVKPTSIPQPMSLLYPVDREALQALYGDFGDWSSVSTHLHGNGEHAAFGVALRNGYAEPWAHGYMPESVLANNTALSGTANWEGTLLGFTLDAEPVAGDAALSVGLGTMTGQADFTSLESWAAGAAPGDAGTGMIWGDGDLAYSISVIGNTFKQTGGDDGILTGAFFGESHEGMGGTLERDDLTAAFGGKR